MSDAPEAKDTGLAAPVPIRPHNGGTVGPGTPIKGVRRQIQTPAVGHPEGTWPTFADLRAYLRRRTYDEPEPVDGDDEFYWFPVYDEPQEVCKVCGAAGACAYDILGEPMIHTTSSYLGAGLREQTLTGDLAYGYHIETLRND